MDQENGSATTDRGHRILAINGGSSSLKFALFESISSPNRLLWGKVERIGLENPLWTATDHTGSKESRTIQAPDHTTAVQHLIDALGGPTGLGQLVGVGHRIVHGGPRFHQPERITAEVVAELRRISPLDPEHLPAEIALIEAFQNITPALPQVACFDTSFHHNMPREAQIVAIPRRFESLGVRRYGFHGISYTFLMQELARREGNDVANGRVILAHLGAGASMAAVLHGSCIDTSMGFTPTSGLVMGTRTGDLDPGLVRFLMQTESLSIDSFDEMVNRQSGMKGISETSPDVRDLMARQQDDIRAAEAISVFCYEATKRIGSYAAALGGLDSLVFSGGIGENSPEIRERICARLGFLGIAIDPERNRASSPIISTEASTTRVYVIPTDEERMIATETARLVS